jgi:hypothetical protein
MGLRIGQPLESMEIEIQEKLLETLKNSKEKDNARAFPNKGAFFLLNYPHKKCSLHQHLSGAKTLGCSDKRLSGNERQRARFSYQGVRKQSKKKKTRARSLVRKHFFKKIKPTKNVAYTNIFQGQKRWVVPISG